MTSPHQKTDRDRRQQAPISIWTFSGIVLLVYAGLLLAGLLYPLPKRVVIVTGAHPNLLWAAVLASVGVLLLLAGVKSRGN